MTGMLSDQARQFVQQQAATILGSRWQLTDLAPEVAERWFREWSRTTERENSARDLWGNWDFPYGESNGRGLLYEPWLDQQVLGLRGALDAAAPDRAPIWPEGHRFALCLTHDLDHVTLEPSPQESLRHLGRDLRFLLARTMSANARDTARHACLRAVFRLVTLKGLRPRRERTYDEWLGLEARYGFRSTFLVFPERVSAPHPYDCTYAYGDRTIYSKRRLTAGGLIHEIDRAGWEIGLHGSYLSAVRAGLLTDQKRQVERLIERAVVSTRQHWLHYDVCRTPQLQAEAGLQVDSTQGFNRNVGFRAGTSFPYPCWDHTAGTILPVLEIPLHVMDAALFAPNGLSYPTDLATSHCIRLMDAVAAVGGCLTLNWHPNTLQYPEYWSAYEEVLAEAARRNAWGCSMREIREWWSARALRIEAAARTRS